MVEISDIQKRFGKKEVLRGVSATLESGRIYALLGPNGCGKSTLFKSVMGLVRPDSGQILIDGLNPILDAAARDVIGFMPQHGYFPENIAPSRLFDMMAGLRPHREAHPEPWIDLFNLHSHLNVPCGNLSGGTRQKVSAVIALMFNPKVILLDEPTAGLDPHTNFKLKRQLEKSREEGKTLLLSSHIVSDVAELADELLFLWEGKIMFKGSADSLMNKYAANTFEEAMALAFAQTEEI
jgi:Cu-processing system ATP-binding protein